MKNIKKITDVFIKKLMFYKFFQCKYLGIIFDVYKQKRVIYIY